MLNVSRQRKSRVMRGLSSVSMAEAGKSSEKSANKGLIVLWPVPVLQAIIGRIKK